MAHWKIRLTISEGDSSRIQIDCCAPSIQSTDTDEGERQRAMSQLLSTYPGRPGSRRVKHHHKESKLPATSLHLTPSPLEDSYLEAQKVSDSVSAVTDRAVTKTHRKQKQRRKQLVRT